MDSPIGPLLLSADGEGLCGVRLLDRESACLELPKDDAACSLLNAAQQQLEAYFSENRKEFDLPLHAWGTAFEQAVWRELAAIPYGETRSYAQIARAIGRPKAFRAVGAACSRNPLLIVVPCHRVIASSGSLTGFAAGLPAKRALLSLERIRLKGDSVI